MNKPRISILVEPLSWLAGVLDSCASFYLWESGGHWHWRIVLSTNETTARKFAALTEVNLRRLASQGSGARWSISGATIAPLLAQLLPRMFCLHEECGALYRALITRPGLGEGKMRGTLSESVIEYRRVMMRRARGITDVKDERVRG